MDSAERRAGSVEELHWWTAHELAAAIRRRELSCVEVMEAHLARIADVDPLVNAIVTLVPDRALADAKAADRRQPEGPLHGLPIAIKDLVDTAGIRTTYGSPIYADHVPDADALLVERLRAAGAIVIGKTNTPEFGAGSHTFNRVFGSTRNPYDLHRSAGGSSGGAAAAVATGMLPLADASDYGGSIRNPASFCNLVGLRPSPGRVPSGDANDAWDPMSVLGPIGRNVADVGLLLSAMAGRDDRSPLSLDEDPGVFANVRPADLRGARIAWSRDADGLPIDPAVTAVLEGARTALVDLGASVDELEPDLSGADEAFETLRALAFLAAHGADLEAHPGEIKPVVVDEIERGRALTSAELVRAGTLRTELHRRIVGLLTRYDLLALPTVQVPPFPVELEWPAEIDGKPMERYITWMRACSRITTTGLPALSVPAGFSPDGLPVGLQLVGRPRDELTLLGFGAAFEAATRFGSRRPPLPSGPGAT